MKLLLLALLAAAGSAVAQPIKIGELNSYKVFPAFLEPYKKGFELAIEEINAKGGINGRKLEIVSRDDGGTPGDAVRVAEELISREKADVLMGTFASNVGLAVANLAAQRKVVFLAAEPLTDKIVWENGNAYTFRLRPSTYMQVAMLVPEAAKLKKKRWAIVYPNYEYGQSATESFKKLLKAVQPDVEFVAEQASPLGKIDAGAVVQALADAKPDAIFSSLFAADLQKFVREGNTRGLFADRSVFNLLGGEPEYLDPLKDETPEGWWVTGYPWSDIKTLEHTHFRQAYEKRWNDYPRVGSVVGYTAVYAIAEGLRKAGSTDPQKLSAALAGLQMESPFGRITWRAIDHQSTMGAYVGQLAKKDGRGVMVNWHYADGARYQPSDAEIRKLRKD
ncbi:MAG: ABC transporter substrate-binding protein [Betaproteobacteria bacterium]|nr:ABC transporter substrate-binding protein [Betaproteobacteria bacterium]MBV9361691.1 ABC transporter substrate-binding protein [Betaproteobacteria bacterium]